MAHESEADFEIRVQVALEQMYGAENVERQVVLPASHRRPDFVVEDTLATYYVELESEFDAAIEGVGQSLLYAAHEPQGRGVPVVIVPDGHLDEPEEEFIRHRTPAILLEGSGIGV
jgi:hypothetical protein